MKRFHFSLIELLVVIAILGVLATMMIPKFMNVEEDARKGIAKYNSAALVGLLNNYQAANNGRLPSRFHTGLTTDGQLIPEMPDIIKKHLENIGVYNDTASEIGQEPVGLEIVSASATQFRGSFTNAGLYEFTYGSPNTPEYKRVGKDDSGSFETIYLLKVKGNIFSGTFGNSGKFDAGECIRIGGTRLGEWATAAPITKIGVGTADDDEKFDVYMLFLGEDVQWGTIRDANGNVIQSSRVMLDGKTNANATSGSFVYPVVFLQHFKTRPARVLGVISFNSTGSKLENPNK